ncbi:MAG: methylmalonyl Co-A mutase-associated GTPase MeaB [Arachnia sp.]
MACMRNLRAPELADQLLAGSRPHIARAITLVESSRPEHREIAHELLQLISPHTGASTRVGISGVPGAGKSTFIDALGVRLIEQGGHRIAVLAVDPSSTRTGGSILGDRTRMADLANRPEAFVRPSPTAGQLGGVARATRESMLILEAAGYDVVLVETVGVGQSEVAVSGMVDTFLMLQVARTGDQLQGIKRGILELADVIAITKADGDNEAAARVAARELAIAMKLISSDADRRRTPVLTCSSYTGAGLDDVWQAVLKHRAGLETDGGLAERRLNQQREWLWSLAREEILESLRTSPEVRAAAERAEQELAAEALSALEGSQRILSTFASVVPHQPWAQAEAGESSTQSA